MPSGHPQQNVLSGTSPPPHGGPLFMVAGRPGAAEGSRVRAVWGMVFLLVVSAACSETVRLTPAPDAGPDAGPTDAGPDAGPSDAGPDAGPSDAGPDAGPTDAGPDAGPTDAGPDAGPP